MISTSTIRRPILLPVPEDEYPLRSLIRTAMENRQQTIYHPMQDEQGRWHWVYSRITEDGQLYSYPFGRRGFATFDMQRRKEIASEGGRKAHQLGHAHKWTSEEAQQAGRKGGKNRYRRQRAMQAMQIRYRSAR